jgi:cytochrome P450
MTDPRTDPARTGAPAGGRCPVVHFDHHAPGLKQTAPAVYADLRDRCPVGWSEAHGGFWVVSRYDQVFEAARDQRTFSAQRSVVLPVSDVGFLPPLETDPPGLDRYRAMLSPFFTPGAVRAMEPTIRHAVTAAVDGFIERGHAELVEELVNPVPARTTMKLLGMDPDDWRYFADPLHDASYATPGSARHREAQERIRGFTARIEAEVDARLAAPRDDLISALLAHEAADGRRASRDEVIGLVRMVIFGGMDTVMAATGNALVRIGRDDRLRRRLREEPGLLPTAIEEFLRVDPPVQGFARTVTRDCELGGRPLAAGETVFLLWASANRDPDTFDRAEEIVIDRSPNRHMTFGIGPHRCLGSTLARLEMRVLLSEVLTRLPDYALVEERLAAPETIGIVNGWAAVPVRFTPGPRVGR